MEKAINNTTVEVTFEEDVTDVKALDFAIEGLTISNAVIKQTNKKTVVLTTSAQTADVEYTVTVDGEKVGSFKGVSAVVPTKVDLVSSSVQGKLGQQVTVQAKVTVAAGQSAAGIPVTFNATSNNPALNASQVVEAVTDANGVATYTYTRYAAGNDTVVAYSTGDRSKFSTGYVFWGVETIVSIEEVTTGATINNGANKTYKVTYKNATTGKPEANKVFNVSVLENINVTAEKLQNVTVNGEAVKQLTNDTAPVAAQITTDSKGEATFTISGTNTAEVTPVVFEAHKNSGLSTYGEKYETSDLQAHAAKVKFSALQAEYTIDVTRDGGEVAATGYTNGREYKVTVKNKKGEVAKNEVVNIAFNENLDRVISTNTDAYFVEVDANGNRVYTPNLDQITVTTNAKGEASFVIANDTVSTYATPVAWIDINSAYVNKQGNLDEGEPKTVAAISYFEAEKLDGASLKVKDANGKFKDTVDLKGNVAAEFKVEQVNQSGETTTIGSLEEVTYTIHNTGSSVIYIGEAGLTTAVSDSEKISPNRSKTVKLTGAQVLKLSTYEGKSGSVKVVATGKVKHEGKEFNFVAKEATATFKSLSAIVDSTEGIVTNFNSDTKRIKIGSKDTIDFKAADADKKVKYYYISSNGAKVTTGFEHFSTLVADYATNDVTVAYYKDSNGNIELTVIGSTAGVNDIDGTLVVVDGEAAVVDTVATTLLGGLTFTSSVGTDLNGYNIVTGTVADGTPESATLTGKTITINGDFSNKDASNNYSAIADINVELGKLTLPNNATVAATGTVGAIPAGATSLAFSGGKVAAPAKNEVATYTVKSGAKVAGDIKVTLANPAVTVDVTLVAGDDAATVAGKIAAKLTSVTGYNVTVTGANVVFTSTTGTNATDLTVTIVNK